jgi:hypothetical protein
MPAREPGKAAALAPLVFALATPLTYGVERALEVLAGSPSDPRTVLRSLHTAYYWRVAIAVWWGVVIALLWFALFSGSERRWLPALRAAAIVVAAGFFICAFALP